MTVIVRVDAVVGYPLVTSALEELKYGRKRRAQLRIRGGRGDYSVDALYTDVCDELANVAGTGEWVIEIDDDDRSVGRGLAQRMQGIAEMRLEIAEDFAQRLDARTCSEIGETRGTRTGKIE